MNERLDDMGDDKALDEYLAGGSAVSQRYRDLGADVVPPELDRRVLQRARAEVARPSRAQTWRRWSVPVALAASLVLAVAVLLETGVRQERTSLSTRATSSQAPAPASGPAALGSERKSEISREESARRLPEAPLPAEREMIVQIAPVPATVPAPAFVPPPGEKQSVSDIATPAPAAPAAASTESPGAHDDPARWLESIRQLRKDGKAEEADQEWEKFRAAFPDYTVAETDAARPRR